VSRVIAQDTEALAVRGRRQPCAGPRRIGQPVDVLEQPNPGGLRDIGGVGIAQPMRAPHGPDHAAELGDERVPTSLVAGGS
jgi:hypothetical protein